MHVSTLNQKKQDPQYIYCYLWLGAWRHWTVWAVQVPDEDFWLCSSWYQQIILKNDANNYGLFILV